MVAKTITLSCSECGTEYSVTSANWESLEFCPFCGESNLLPVEDMDDQDDEAGLSSFDDDDDGA
jgi:rRNA maturation endonuclease Nob1